MLKKNERIRNSGKEGTSNDSYVRMEELFLFVMLSYVALRLDITQF